MNLNNLPFPVWGDQSYRGDCPVEDAEQISFFNRLRTAYPDSYGLIAYHPANEGLVKSGQFKLKQKQKLMGQTKGASDVIIPARIPFICELKRQNHMKSAWQDGQIQYLTTAQSLGAYACVALGAQAAWDAFLFWLTLDTNHESP